MQKKVEIRENNKLPAVKSGPQINGMYELAVDTDIYAAPNDENSYDRIERGSVVKVLTEEEDGFVRVDYFGNIGYVEAKNLRN